MRALVFLLGLAMATVGAPVAAQNYGAVYFNGPSSGMWQSYRIDFSTPPDYSFLSFTIDYTQCFNGLSDETYTCLDSPEITGGCDAMSVCPAPYLRRVDFDATGVDFAFYIPRTVFFCQDYPPANKQNISCADIYEGGYGFLDFQYSGADPDVTLTVTGGGAVPEPASWAMLITGFALIGAALRRRQALPFNRAA